MTNPWGGLDADTVNKKLYLDPTVISEVNRVFEPYEESLETLIGDSLDETTGYFGTPENPLAVLVQKRLRCPRQRVDRLPERSSCRRRRAL